jgi:hypothetical protein
VPEEEAVEFISFKGTDELVEQVNRLSGISPSRHLEEGALVTCVCEKCRAPTLDAVSAGLLDTRCSRSPAWALDPREAAGIYGIG